MSVILIDGAVTGLLVGTAAGALTGGFLGHTLGSRLGNWIGEETARLAGMPVESEKKRVGKIFSEIGMLFGAMSCGAAGAIQGVKIGIITYAAVDTLNLAYLLYRS